MLGARGGLATALLIIGVGLLAFVLPWSLSLDQRALVFAVPAFAWLAVVHRRPSSRQMGFFPAPVAMPRRGPVDSFVPAVPPAALQRETGETSYRQWEGACRRAISDLIVRSGIHCTAARVRGPFTLTYDLDMVADEVAGLNKLKTLAPALLAKLHTPVSIRLDPTRGILLEINLPKELAQTPNAFELARHSQWPEIPMGIDSFNQVVTVNPQEHGAMYWIAPPRRGKTASMRSTLALARLYLSDMRFIVMAMPAKIRENWGAFDGIDGCLGLVGDFGEMQQALEWAVAEMHERASRSPTFIVLDDLANLTANLPKAGPLLKELALAGPGLGYHLMAGTHSAGSGAATGGDALIQAAMTAKILFKASGNSAGARSSDMRNDETGMNQLSGAPGDGVLLLNGTPCRVATCQIREDQILKLPLAQEEPAHPWRTRPRRVPSRPVEGVGAPAPVVLEPEPQDDHERRLELAAGLGLPVTEGQYGEEQDAAVSQLWQSGLFESPRQLTSYVFGYGESDKVNSRRYKKVAKALAILVENEGTYVQ